MRDEVDDSRLHCRYRALPGHGSVCRPCS